MGGDEGGGGLCEGCEAEDVCVCVCVCWGGGGVSGGVGWACQGMAGRPCERIRDVLIRPGFCLATLGGGGLIQGPTHPEFWHTHRPTNVPPPPGGGGLTPTHPPTHPRTQLRHAIQKTKFFTEVNNHHVLPLPPSHLTQMTMHPSPFMGVGHAHVICNTM